MESSLTLWFKYHFTGFLTNKKPSARRAKGCFFSSQAAGVSVVTVDGDALACVAYQLLSSPPMISPNRSHFLSLNLII